MYTLELRSPAKAQLKRLDTTIRKQVLEKLNELCANFKTRRHIALKGRDRGRFKLQVGNYRASMLLISKPEWLSSTEWHTAAKSIHRHQMCACFGVLPDIRLDRRPAPLAVFTLNGGKDEKTE